MFALRLFVLVLSIWFFWQIYGSGEQELIDRFGDQELIGSSNQRGAQAIQMLIVNTWGKAGMVGFAGLFVWGAIHYLIKEIKEFKRFLKKDKLYNQGLVFDLYDDYKRPFIIQSVKKFFSKAPKPTKRSYPSEKEMEEKLMKNKYYKKR